MDTSQYSRLTLTQREDFSDDLAVFHLTSDEPVEFTPGQYATIGLIDDDRDRPLLRPYSVVNAPGSTDLEFFIERVDDGDLTPELWSLDEGAEVWMRDKIVGRFVLDEDVRQHVMVATVTGVGPYVSIIRDQIRALDRGEIDEPHEMLILHGGSRSWELGTYRGELSRLAETYDWIEYVPTVSRPWEDPEWDGELGRVEDVLRKHLDRTGFEPGETAAYTCGHPRMIDKAQGIFERAGFPEDAIHEEKYFVERRNGSGS
jgi:ferredoxin--NADP+ reductase